MVKDFGTLSYRPNKENPTRIVARYHTPMYAFSLWQGLPKVQSKSFPIMQQRAAEDWLRKAEYEIEERIWVPPQEVKRREIAERTTFNAYFPSWLENRRVKGKSLKASTKYSITKAYENHIKPILGEVALADITAQMVNDFRSSLDSSRPDMVRTTMRVLRAIVNSALRPSLNGEPPILKISPFTVGEAKVERNHKVVIATPEEVKTIYEEMPEAYAPSVLLASLGAFRIGEICALKVSDIDFKRNTVTISRTRATTPNATVLTTSPKTENSNRCEVISGELVECLKKFVKEQGLSKDDWLFPTRTDKTTPIRTNTLRYYYDKAKLAANRPDLHFHDLRHTCLTWLAQSGATVKELMDMAGHSDPKIAMIYQHAADERRREQAEALGGRLFGES
ncbi:hypothetical protein CJI54_00025 [Bifidobacteriaceae bacterium NR026]|nr:hypothetical protein CJI54_00025 [Bifidobacteriaceae bacterium NR026]